MNSLRFEWDPGKATLNFKKHGVSFDEARTVFFDERARLIDDPDHSDGEDRFILLGLSSAMRVVLVCHCLRGDDQLIRIISARKATPRESKSYAGGG
jgi:uncharacterized DUF497 family protein